MRNEKKKSSAENIVNGLKEIVSVNDINDDKVLAKMYFSSKSRGKRQRIRNRIMQVKSIDKTEVEVFLSENKVKAPEVQQKVKNSLNLSEYQENVVEAKQTNINKKKHPKKKKRRR